MTLLISWSPKSSSFTGFNLSLTFYSFFYIFLWKSPIGTLQEIPLELTPRSGSGWCKGNGGYGHILSTFLPRNKELLPHSYLKCYRKKLSQLKRSLCRVEHHSQWYIPVESTTDPYREFEAGIMIKSYLNMGWEGQTCMLLSDKSASPLPSPAGSILLQMLLPIALHGILPVCSSLSQKLTSWKAQSTTAFALEDYGQAHSNSQAQAVIIFTWVENLCSPRHCINAGLLFRDDPWQRSHSDGQRGFILEDLA